MASIFDRFRSRPARASASTSLSADRPDELPDELPLDMDPAEFMERWTSASTGENPLLDVRRPDEFAQGHLAEAVLVDVTAPDFQSRIRTLSLDPDAPVYLYCRTGNRSGHAARILRDMGIGKAVNVGGLDELVAAGGTLARDD
jgi:phage shock protein E